MPTTGQYYSILLLTNRDIFPILEFPQQGTGDNTRPVFIKTVFINNISQSDMQDRFSKVRSLWQ